MEKVRNYLVANVLCPAAFGNLNRDPLKVTLHIMTVNGVREGMPDVVCPKLLDNKCTAGFSQPTVAEINDAFLRGMNLDTTSLPDCIQKNPS